MSEGSRGAGHRSAPLGIEHLAPGAARAARRGGLRVASRPLPGSRARLRRHLPDPARRRRANLGGPRAGRALRGPAVAGPRARRGHRERCRYLARPAGGAALRASTRSHSAASTRAATSTSRSASKGSSVSRAAGRRCCRSPTSRFRAPRSRSLVSGDGPEPGGLPPRPRLEQGLVLRDGLGPDPRPHGPRDRPAGVRRLVETRARRLRRSVLRPRGARLHGRHGASSERTWWATRWAAGSRWSWRSPTRTGP